VGGTLADNVAIGSTPVAFVGGDGEAVATSPDGYAILYPTREGGNQYMVRYTP
jgi:hypothetical protein